MSKIAKKILIQKNPAKLSMNKSKKSVLSFIVIGFLLTIMFVIAVNTGSLSVSIGKLFKGLFVSYDADVATIASTGAYFSISASMLCLIGSLSGPDS